MPTASWTRFVAIRSLASASSGTTLARRRTHPTALRSAHMREADLLALLRDDESDRSERTESTRDTDKFGEAICAFANDLPNHRRPGYLFIGATSEGRASGAQITDQLLQNLAAIRSDGNLLPAPTMTVAKHALGGGEVAVVEVIPSDLPPVRYKGKVWVRVGPRRALATEADERVLSERRTSLARTWDARPCHAADLSDLVLSLFEAYKLEAIAPEVLSRPPLRKGRPRLLPRGVRTIRPLCRSKRCGGRSEAARACWRSPHHLARARPDCR